MCGRPGRDLHFLSSFFPLRVYVVSSSWTCHRLHHFAECRVQLCRCDVMILYLNKKALWKLVRKHLVCLERVRKIWGGGGGKALTMTMTPWNLPHGQWSKKLTMTMTPSILPMVNGQIDKF